MTYCNTIHVTTVSAFEKIKINDYTLFCFKSVILSTITATIIHGIKKNIYFNKIDTL